MDCFGVSIEKLGKKCLELLPAHLLGLSVRQLNVLASSTESVSYASLAPGQPPKVRIFERPVFPCQLLRLPVARADSHGFKFLLPFDLVGDAALKQELVSSGIIFQLTAVSTTLTCCSPSTTILLRRCVGKRIANLHFILIFFRA